MFVEKQCPNCGKSLSVDLMWEFCPLCGKKYSSPPGSRKKRGNGQGTVTKISKGNWKAIAVIGWKDDTHPIRRTKSGFKTKTEALAYLPTLYEKCSTEAHSPSLKELYADFMQTHNVKKSTIDCYNSAFKYFSDLHSMEFREITIDDWQKSIDGCPKGRRTKENMRAIVSLLYRYAIPRGYVAPELMSFKGEFIRINEKGSSTSDKTGFTEDEVNLLWKYADEIPMAGVILLMCYTGFRIGEFLNLEYRDGCLIGGSKTAAGKNRIVPVSPKVERFVNHIPHDITVDAFRKEFYAALSACGIQNNDHHLTPHSTRHTFATLLKNVSAPDADKLRLIGHTSEEMLRYYQDVSVDDLREITDRL